MASVGEEDVEYESDPEEVKLSLKMRRREASDDEEEEEGDVEARERREKSPRRLDSEGESNGEGGAAEYDDDEESDIEDDVEEYDDEDEEGEGLDVEEYEESGEQDGVGARDEVEAGTVDVEAAEAGKEIDGGRFIVDHLEVHQDLTNQVDEEEEEEKKENEPPFSVPTAGAFYMHDDRFRDNVGGRHRRTFGGRKLWESKDDRKWGHDKFEEMSIQDRHYDEGRRTSRGRFRGRGKNRGADHGYPRGNRPKVYNNNSNNSSHQMSNASKGVRGRGPRRYQPSTKSKSDALMPNKQPGKSVEKASHADSEKMSVPTPNVEFEPVSFRKHAFASSLSSASPPFYPSGASNKDTSLTQEMDAQTGTVNQNLRPSVIVENISISQSNAVLRGKNVADTVGLDKLYIDDRKVSSNLQFPVAGSSLLNSTTSTQPRAQGGGLPSLGPMTYQPTVPHNQVNRVSKPTQLQTVQRSTVQSRVQPSSQVSGQLPGQHLAGSQASSPPKTTLSINSFEPGEMEAPLESSKSRTALVGKGKSSQGSGRGSFLYGGGAQVIGGIGNTGGGHGDQNFSTTPAFLPVMQFGGQHPGGIGVPAVGMAFPGYVAQPQLGLGSSEMTWLPVLAGAAGALGATYCSPYLSVDGGYHSRPSGQTSSLPAALSKEYYTNKSNNEWKPAQKPELANDEFGQRQNKPRRYTEMKFDQ